MPTSTDLLQGTLDLLILQTLTLEPMHGWGVAQRIQQVSNEALQIGQGSLYPALYRLEYKGWIKAEWGNSENNRQSQVLSADGGRPKTTGKRTADVGPVVDRNRACARPHCGGAAMIARAADAHAVSGVPQEAERV